MNAVAAASGSVQASNSLARLWAVRQELLAEGLLSPFHGGSISVKATTCDVYGETVEALLLLEPSSDALLVARLTALRALGQLEQIPEAERLRELSASRLEASSPLPGDLALLHASLAAPAVLMVTHPTLLALGCTPEWQGALHGLLGEEVLLLDYAALGSGLFRAAAEAARASAAGGLYLRYYGLLVWDTTLEGAAQAARTHLERARKGSVPDAPITLGPIPPTSALRVEIAQCRLEVSRALGAPHLLRLVGLPPSDLPASLLGAPGASSMLQLQSRRELPAVESAPGMLVHSTSADGLDFQAGLLLADLQIRAAAGRRGALELLQGPAVSPAQQQGMFCGEVALVTGAATGIGRAAVHSLLQRGAAVVALDIKPEIAHTFDGPAYLGLECDLTDEAKTLDCLEKAVRAFGGLDMLVLNAGIFPASRTLDSMSMEYWRQVMQINLDVNVTLLRESYPLLKRAPRYGRVVINGSRNVPAPGPGAAGYSASKAALNQLGRVAALEWADCGIRVNMLNPHAVFDTGIWTDEVLRSRAAKYGLTVEQYKTNNLLHVELTSADLGELIAEMLGPLFSKTTGAQLPVDGGSDRVI